MQNVHLPPEVGPTFLALHAAASPRLAAWMEEHVAQLSPRIRTAQRRAALARVHTFGPYRVIPEPHDDGGSILNWSVEADLYDADEKQKIAFSASLTFALADRAFSDPWERPIPESTMAKLESLAVRLSAAGLF